VREPGTLIVAVVSRLIPTTLSLVVADNYSQLPTAPEQQVTSLSMQLTALPFLALTPPSMSDLPNRLMRQGSIRLTRLVGYLLTQFKFLILTPQVRGET
jgi:hypothetical protein